MIHSIQQYKPYKYKYNYLHYTEELHTYICTYIVTPTNCHQVTQAKSANCAPVIRSGLALHMDYLNFSSELIKYKHFLLSTYSVYILFNYLLIILYLVSK